MLSSGSMRLHPLSRLFLTPPSLPSLAATRTAPARAAHQSWCLALARNPLCANSGPLHQEYLVVTLAQRIALDMMMTATTIQTIQAQQDGAGGTVGPAHTHKRNAAHGARNNPCQLRQQAQANSGIHKHPLQYACGYLLPWRT